MCKEVLLDTESTKPTTKPAELGLVAHICKTSDSGGRARRMRSSNRSVRMRMSRMPNLNVQAPELNRKKEGKKKKGGRRKSEPSPKLLIWKGV